MSRNIKFSSFNLYNLQSPGKKWRKNAAPYTQDQYNGKINWSANQLSRIDADIIAFQELWSKECLEDIFDKAGLSSNYDLVFIKDSWYDIAVAAAVRKPWKLSKKKIHKAFSEGFVLKKRSYHKGQEEDREDDDIDVKVDKFSRSIIEMEIDNNDYNDIPTITVFTVHFKSKLPTRLDKLERENSIYKPHLTPLGSAISTIRRTAESAALRIIINESIKSNDKPAVVLGDLNDSQLSNTLAILTNQPKYRLRRKSNIASSNDVGLFSAGILQELGSLRDVYYTHEFNGVKESLDHILVTEQFYDYSNNRYWSFDKMDIINDHIDDEDKNTSDHGIISAKFIWHPS